MSSEKLFMVAPAAVLIALIAALATGTAALSPVLGQAWCYQPIPFILGGAFAGPPALGWSMPPWAFGQQCHVTGLPLYFNAHGFGFPMTLGNFRIGLIPS
jgi:hypothetical protein